MKNFLTMAFVLLSLLTAHTGVAATKHTAKKTTAKADKKTSVKKDDGRPQLGTSFKFAGSNLRGKYNTALGATATVEDDKYLDDLLGGRKQFEDRLQKDQERN
jgi:hypothetical protein